MMRAYLYSAKIAQEKSFLAFCYLLMLELLLVFCVDLEVFPLSSLSCIRW